ncbi:hypothetical protein MTR_4g055843 [Medicago truncatula]|uniref:Uncharacterized protein n=1 Tax=Medicago truncatula TaxID=3880 RepID=A0A072ULH7_MEDTR|nr:hypothetical protein MTR_4g055843 [Medicago truncatula]
MTENIKIHHIFYVTESLHKLCLGDVFSLSLGLSTKQARPDQVKTGQAVDPCRPAWPIPNPSNKEKLKS